jgi:hypothetical protein
MELSERAIQTLETEGCVSVYEQDWVAKEKSVLHTKTIEPLQVYVTEGELQVPTNDVGGRFYQAGERFSVAPHTEVLVIAGPAGARAVIGE